MSSETTMVAEQCRLHCLRLQGSTLWNGSSGSTGRSAARFFLHLITTVYNRVPYII